MNELDIFSHALTIEDLQDREVYLTQACGDDVELRKRVEKLLRNADPDSFLESPPVVLPQSTVDVPVVAQIGEEIGQYKLLQRIGEGGMGLVFMAEQKHPVKRRVALKVIKPGMDSQQVVARFEAERQALALMDHPNIARALDVGTTESGRPYFVMELVKGRPITQYCDDQRLSPRQRLELFLPICNAIQHAHQKGIIHRDIKPSNILVAEYDNQPVPKIIDFGVAKALNQTLTEKTMFTQLGQVIGTLEYMSPEQAKVNQLDIDTRSDIYSLGVLLYELLTGSPPFDPERLRSAAWDEVMRIIREEDAPRMSVKLGSSATLPSVAAFRRFEPSKLGAYLRGELDWIVMKALDKERNRRYETASALGQDLQRFLDDEPVQACPPSLNYRLRKFARRNRTALTTATLLLIALLAGLAGTSWQAAVASRERNDANEARDLAHKRLDETNAALELEEQQRKRAERAEALANDQLNVAIEARREAEEQASIANAISEFLRRDLLAMADVDFQFDSDIEPDPDLKLITLLDRARERLNRRFIDEPLVKAEILHALSLSYYALGKYSEAIELGKERLQLHQDNLGDQDARTLDSMIDLAGSLAQGGEFEQAIDLNQEVLRASISNSSLSPNSMLVVRRNLAACYHYQGRYQEAIEEYEAILESEDAPQVSSNEIIIAQCNLAGAHAMIGQISEAQAICDELLGLPEDVLPPLHPNRLRALTQQALVYRNQGLVGQAIPIYEEVIALSKQVHPLNHPTVLSAMSGLAISFALSGNTDRSTELFEQMIEVREQAGGGNHPLTLNDKASLAELYRRGRKFDQAIALLESVIEARTKRGEQNSPDTLSAIQNLALVYHTVGRTSEAADLCEQVIEVWDLNYSDRWLESLLWRNNLASYYRTLDRGEEALALLEQVVDKCFQHPDALPANTPIYLKNLAEAYSAVDDHVRSIEAYGRALNVYRQRQAEPDQFIWDCLRKSANEYKALKAFDKAAPILEEMLSLRRRTAAEEDADTLKLFDELANTYYQAFQLEKSLNSYSELLEIQERVLGIDSKLALGTRIKLIALRHCESGNWAKAVEEFSKTELAFPFAHYFQALSLLGSQDMEAYHQTVDTMIDRFGDSQNLGHRNWVAWTAILRPFPKTREESITKIAESLIEKSDSPAMFRLTHAAVQMRCGHIDEAISALLEIEQEWKREGDEHLDPVPVFYVWSLLALSNARLGKADQTEYWLSKVDDWFADRNFEGVIQVPWNHRLSEKLLREEARDLLSQQVDRKTANNAPGPRLP